MQFLRKWLDKQEEHFSKSGRFKLFYPVYELIDTFLYTPGTTTHVGSHIRDALDQKRLMWIVVLALIPCTLWACFNTGYQINIALDGQAVQNNWRHQLYFSLGFVYNSSSILSNFIFGLIYFLPVYMVVMLAGGLVELLFAIIRKHPISEGFLVTGLLIPLVLPPTIPLYLAAIGTIFGITFGKEIFGGVGRNFLNPALTVRAFLFFAYPAYLSGNAVWTAVDGFSGVTILGVLTTSSIEVVIGSGISWWDAFWGFIPGSMGETSTFACLLGAVVLLVTGIASWRTMLSCLLGMISMSLVLNLIGSETNPLFSLPAHWHLVLGGFSFGLVFMATDPVSSAFTNKGKYYYGSLIGVMVVLIRVINPAFPEGMMLAILFANVFAPLIDYFVVQSTQKRRKLRSVVSR